MANLDLAFTDAYKEECFVAYYSAGRPKSANAIRDVIPTTDSGSKPSAELIRKWRDGYNWAIRADELDALAYEKTNEMLVEKRSQMLKRQAQSAFKLQQKALDHILGDDNNPGKFDSSAAAVSAFFKAVELEQQSTGVSDMLLRMSKLTPEQLTKQLGVMIRRAADSGQIIDVLPEEIEEKKETNEEEDTDT